MRWLPVLLTICAYAAPLVQAQQGCVFLQNGKSITGDIQRCDDGGCWVIKGKGSVKFDKSEIKRIRIDSKRDLVQERFISAFRATPGEAPAPRSVTTPYDNAIHSAARKHRVDPALVKAVIKAESNFNPFDTSYKGACGLMQLMPGTAKILGVKQIYSPQENIDAGTRYLRDMLYLFNGNVEKALAAYNAGPAVVKRYQSVPPFTETRNYIRNVFRYYRDYNKKGKVRSYTDNSGALNIYNVQ